LPNLIFTVFYIRQRRTGLAQDVAEIAHSVAKKVKREALQMARQNLDFLLDDSRKILFDKIKAA